MRGVGITSSSAYGSPSTVSDAASSSAQKLLNHVELSKPMACRRLNFKKRKTRPPVLDKDPLEDTASSPVSTPKVSGMGLDIISCKKEENYVAAEAESSSIDRPPLQPEDRNKMLHFATKNECTELKKRGLCLMPLSMLADYVE